MTEMKAFITHILQNFRLEPVDLAHEITILPDVVLRPACPMRVKFVPINNKVK